jgi:hypothetical protein
MRKSPSAAPFGTRGVVAPTLPAIEAKIPKPKRRRSYIDMTVHYGAIVKIVIALWAATIVAAMLWP